MQLIDNVKPVNESRYNRLSPSVRRSSSTHERSWRRGHHGKIYDHGLFFFFFFFFAIRSPNFSSFLFSFPLLFFSSFLCIFTARLFGSRLFGIGGVALSRQCGKMNFLKAKILRFFRTLEASTVLPIHAGLLIFISHIVCVPMYSNVLNL